MQGKFTIFCVNLKQCHNFILHNGTAKNYHRLLQKWNFKHAYPACPCGHAASARGIRADGRRSFLYFLTMQGGACPQVGSPFGQSPQSRIFAGFIDRPKATIPTNEKTKITSAYKKMGINHAQKASSRLRRNPGKTQNHRRITAEFNF